jgi:two-component system LytT family response regulator
MTLLALVTVPGIASGDRQPHVQGNKGLAATGRTVRRHATVLPIRVGRETIRLDVSTIDWVDAAGDYMCLHAAGQTHVLRATMKELEEMLDPRLFQRVHRSTIVNLARVAALRPHLNGECFLRLQSGQEIKLSRSYRDKVEMLLDSAGIAPGAARTEAV